MLDSLAPLAVLVSTLLILPAIFTAFLILKEINVTSIRQATYFKFFLAQVFLHSLFLIAALYHPSYDIPFLMHSFVMLPLYTLLLFRLYHLKWKRNQRLIVHKALVEEKKAKAMSEQFRRQRLRIRALRKSKWH